MEDKRLLIALLLSMAVLFGWQALFPPPEPPPPERDGPRTELPVAPESAAPDAGSAPAPAEPTPRAEAELREGAPQEPPEEITGSREQTVEVDMDLYRAVFTTRGAQLLSFELRRHSAASQEGPVDLVRARQEGPYPFALMGPGDEPSPLNDVLFAVDRSRDENGRPVVEMRHRSAAGEASKRFVFDAEGLVEVKVEVPGQEAWGLALGPGIRNPSAAELGNRFAVRSAVYQLGEDVEQVGASGAKEPALLPGGGLRWVGLQDTYFITVLIPRSPLRDVLVRPLLARIGENGGTAFEALPSGRALTDEEEDLPRELQIVVHPQGGSLVADAYLGSKQYDRLRRLPFGLEKTVELGWFRFLAVPLLKGLQWIHGNMVQNYGWAIILMTVLIKIVLLPLTHKSTVSMRKMQQVSPKIQAIRQKYRGKLKDKKGRPNVEAQQKMNQEIMALYKSEGVNPAGGCLPMLLQIPILFAFYRLLSTAVELRNAPWLLWVQDLSAPDPFYVLPIVMGGSQFLQQKLTPAAGDPMQRRIFLLMPIFFTVLFLGFPAGLVLYWLTNNVLTIIQQTIYNRWTEGDEAGAPSGRRKKAKGTSA